jgi:hypothetical protein
MNVSKIFLLIFKEIEVLFIADCDSDSYLFDENDVITSFYIMKMDYPPVIWEIFL